MAYPNLAEFGERRLKAMLGNGVLLIAIICICSQLVVFYLVSVFRIADCSGPILHRSPMLVLYTCTCISLSLSLLIYILSYHVCIALKPTYKQRQGS